MDKFIQYLVLVLFPFYPLWAWLSTSLTKIYIDKIVILILLPIAVYYVFIQKIKLSKYLIFFLIFTVYHLVLVYVKDLIPANTNWLFYILSDTNVLACIAFFIIENTHFDEKFIRKMNNCIFAIIIITLIVSVIQIKFPNFFLSPKLTGDPTNYLYVEQNRKFSIYSWMDLNSIGISFPILISILLSIGSMEKITFPMTVVSGIVVSFLTRARYVMLSAIIVFSQLFFVSKIDFRKKVYIMLILLFSIIAITAVAKVYNYDIGKVIDERILERGTNLASARARVTSYEVFMIKFPEHPWFGVGPATGLDVVQLLRGQATIIHIGYLSYLYFYGIIGSIFFFLSIFFLLRNSWLIGKKHMFWGSFYGLLSFCIANATLVYFNLSEMGILLAVIYMKYYTDKSSLELPGFKKPQEIIEETVND